MLLQHSGHSEKTKGLGGNVMNIKQEMGKLIASCRDELMEHLMQNVVNSIHIKNANNYLTSMKNILDQDLTITESEISVAQHATKRAVQRGSGQRTNKKDILKMAFALSKFDYNSFNNILGTTLNQGEVFKMVSAFFNLKPATLRNYRDAFDRHVEQVYSNRAGWDSEKLAPDLQEVKDSFDALSEEEIADEIVQTLSKINPDFLLLAQVSYGFLFATKSSRKLMSFSNNNQNYELILAPYPDRVAYMVLIGFGNELVNGIYPGVYAYRKFGKIFTVYGESETITPKDKWLSINTDCKKIRDYFSDDQIQEINKYPNTYLDNKVYKIYELDADAQEYNADYKFGFAQEIVNDIKHLLKVYEDQYRLVNK